MTHPMLTWLLDQIAEDERTARAAQEKALSPWVNSNGLVRHSGAPESGMERDDGLWDDEGTSGMDVNHRLCMWGEVADHVALHDPAAVLADVAAKRAILALHAPATHQAIRYGLPHGEPHEYCVTCIGGTPCECCPVNHPDNQWPCDTVRALGSAFASRDGYDTDWGPT